MSVTLGAHQIKAIRQLRNGSILCGEVGTGKSRTALAYYYICNGGKLACMCDLGTDQRMKDPSDLYIITTAKKRNNFEWELEMAPFLISKDKDVSVYENTVVVDSWNNIKKYREVKGAFFIFDEQRVTGKGAWVKAFLEITKNNRWILLSATPGDTWSDYIPVFVANGFYRSAAEFNREHAVYSRWCTKYPKIDRYIKVGILTVYRNSILVKMPYKKSTVPHHTEVVCDYDKDLYRVVMKERWDFVDNCPIQETGKLCYMLRRAVNIDPDRQRKLMDLLDRHQRTIIFYNFNYELVILKAILDIMGIPFNQWNGDVHEDVPEGDKWSYLVQYNAGCEGWNCVTTDTVIFFSQSYSYRMTVQAEGRIDRLNTPFKDLYYYHMRSQAPIDNAIKKALTNKKDFNERSFLGI